MAKQVKLTAERRETTGRSAMRKLKRRGIIPAIVYGGKEKPQPLQVSRRDINVMLSHASGENILVELEIAGEKSSRMAMIQEIQHSPVGGDVLHVDFHAVSMDEKIEADVPVEADWHSQWGEEFWWIARAELARASGRMFTAGFAG